MRLLAPPPTMKPTPLAIASEVRGSSLIYSPMSRLRRRRRSTSSARVAPVELFTAFARSGDFPNDLRDDIADRECGRDCKPGFTTLGQSIVPNARRKEVWFDDKAYFEVYFDADDRVCARANKSPGRGF